MDQAVSISFDIAAVVVTTICIVSLILRQKISGPVNRVYFSAMVLVLFTALTSLGGEVYDEVLGPDVVASGTSGTQHSLLIRNAFSLLYYTLCGLATPAYLVLITAVSETSHRLNRNNLVRLVLWTPMIAVSVLILSNPLHHLAFTYDSGGTHRGPLILMLYATSLYYSLIGMAWLLRWRRLLDADTFSSLASFYPFVFSAVVIQYFIPTIRLEMFVTAVVLMLLSAFVMRPERQIDSFADAASMHAYRTMVERAFVTEKSLCLVYLEIVNIERLRELVGKDELQKIVHAISVNLRHTLQRGDVLYYLRNGLFCIAPRSTDAQHALSIAQATHERGKMLSRAPADRPAATQMRCCVIRVPEDVNDVSVLRNFVHRFSHLVPESRVTSFAELAKQDDFELQMALSNIVANAIRERSFEVYYQPICCLNDGRFHSAEALVRLNHPKFGYVPPSLFIPEAEQSGAIEAVGSILLDKIFAFLSSMDYEATDLHYIEVNLSVDQCVRPHMARELLGLAQKYDVDPARVNLEITETSSAFSQQAIERNVRTLAEAGFTFSLDDYGAGYSNLTRAISLPFKIIKFDKTLADGLDDLATRGVVEQSVAMMHSIGKLVLVEGVETHEQAEMLRAMGTDYIQGFHYARPLPQDDFLAFLREHNA